jgi:tetratricopeptide (TPR) repeat protein
VNKDLLYQKGREAANQQAFVTAVEILELYVQINPAHDYARYLLAENLIRIGRLVQAEKVLKTVVTIPDEKKWLLELSWGSIYIERGEFALAEICFRNALKSHAASTVTWVFLADCLSKQERFKEACEILEGGLGAEGDLDEVYFNLGFNKRAIKDYYEAANCYRKALEIDPDYAKAKEALKDIENWFQAKKQFQDENI